MSTKQNQAVKHRDRRNELERQTYSVAEVARLLGVDVSIAYREVAKGSIVGVKVLRVGPGGDYKIPKPAIDRALGIEPEPAA